MNSEMECCYASFQYLKNKNLMHDDQQQLKNSLDKNRMILRCHRFKKNIIKLQYLHANNYRTRH